MVVEIFRSVGWVGARGGRFGDVAGSVIDDVTVLFKISRITDSVETRSLWQYDYHG